MADKEGTARMANAEKIGSRSSFFIFLLKRETYNMQLYNA